MACMRLFGYLNCVCNKVSQSDYVKKQIHRYRMNVISVLIPATCFSAAVAYQCYIPSCRIVWKKHEETYIYIYIYICVCVCVSCATQDRLGGLNSLLAHPFTRA